MGVYGDQLAAFPELLRAHEVFRMSPRIGAGYGERYNKRIAVGYVSWRRGDAQAVQGDAAEHEDLGTLWEQGNPVTGESVVRHNDYVELKGTVYRLLEDADFSAEGGFFRWKVKRVPAVTDQQVSNLKVDEVIREDYG
jgi:hypothetical protein